MNQEEMIQTIAQDFAQELAKLKSRMAWPDYSIQYLKLEVTHDSKGAEFKIQATVGREYNKTQVSGTDLGRVMDEVYRRLNFDDKEEARIAASLVALAPPEEKSLGEALDDAIPF